MKRKNSKVSVILLKLPDSIRVYFWWNPPSNRKSFPKGFSNFLRLSETIPLNEVPLPNIRVLCKPYISRGLCTGKKSSRTLNRTNQVPGWFFFDAHLYFWTQSFVTIWTFVVKPITLPVSRLMEASFLKKRESHDSLTTKSVVVRRLSTVLDLLQWLCDPNVGPRTEGTWLNVLKTSAV